MVYPYELAWRKVIELKYPLHKAQCPRLTHRAWRETWAGTIEEETPGGKSNSVKYFKKFVTIGGIGI